MATPFNSGFRSAGPVTQYVGSRVASRPQMYKDDVIVVGVFSGFLRKVERQFDIYWICILILSLLLLIKLYCIVYEIG